MLCLSSWLYAGTRKKEVMSVGNLVRSSREQSLDEGGVQRPPSEDNDFNAAPEVTLTKDDMVLWTWLVSKGIANALSGLSEMVGHLIRVTSLDLRWLSARSAVGLLGGSETRAVGIHLAIHGDATGHLLLIHDPKIAFQLIDLHLDLPPGSTQEIEEMGRCALGDIGNITGTYFLNTLADSASLVLMPSPPTVIVDTVKAIMNVPLTSVMEKQNNALVAKAMFSTDSRQMDGTFMVLPTLDFMKAILQRARTQ